EIARIPLFIAHPGFLGGGRRRALSQAIDLMPTFLDLFGVAPPPTVQGTSLLPLLAEDHALRDVAIFGMFGAATNVTDGRYTYFRYPPDPLTQTLYEYVLIPLHQKNPFGVEELAEAEIFPGFGFTQGMRLMRIPARPGVKTREAPQGYFEDTTTALYDLAEDPGQVRPVQDPAVVARLVDGMTRIMRAHEAPQEAFTRLSLHPPLPSAGSSTPGFN
ncbi:sulfatase, partial [Roseomonas sp. KE2513]|uniref:sulfatase/phosphatase domain-containing protein n=1 Tax=Roseomonas sp. KE2513 TaxID=2479202 RepID=UPI0035CC3D6C|nr:sulfatase [Roseomonas sp. KE2513]